jgi:hypothetical protein
LRAHTLIGPSIRVDLHRISAKSMLSQSLTASPAHSSRDTKTH